MRLLILAFIWLAASKFSWAADKAKHALEGVQPAAKGHSVLDYKSRCHFIKSPQGKNRPLLILIPGGPGFSSLTIRPLEALGDEYDLCLLDPPGTGSAAPLSDYSFGAVQSDLEKAIQAQGRNVILIGQSFGGLQVADLARRGKLKIAGLIAITPLLSKPTLAAYEKELKAYKKNHPALDAAETRYAKDPAANNQEGFKNVCMESIPLLFLNEQAGKTMLEEELRQPSEGYKPLSTCYTDGISDEHLVTLPQALRRFSQPKVLIAAEKDRSLPLGALERDKELAGFDRMVVIPDAGHFPSIDQPEKLLSTLREELARMTEKR